MFAPTTVVLYGIVLVPITWLLLGTLSPHVLAKMVALRLWQPQSPVQLLYRMVAAAMVPSGAGARRLQQAAMIKCSFLEGSLQMFKATGLPCWQSGWLLWQTSAYGG